MTSYANRGKGFETMVEFANDYYAKHGIGIITKLATPTKVVRHFDPQSKSMKIKSAFFEKKSTVDFQGVAYGKPVAFDAKTTVNKNGFNLDMIKSHQMEFLDNHELMGGVSFILVEFSGHKEVYRMMNGELKAFLKNETRKSIPVGWFRKNCHLCSAQGQNPLHYLEGLQ